MTTSSSSTSKGEPARPLAARKAKRSPCVDVAGMLRSLHYASVAAARGGDDGGRARCDAFADGWHLASRTPRASCAPTTTPPRSIRTSRRPERDARSLLALLLLEKCVYELHYELNNRPDWVAIPRPRARSLLEGRRCGLDQLSELDLAGFNAGHDARAYEKLGAHPVRGRRGLRGLGARTPSACRSSATGTAGAADASPLAARRRHGRLARRRSCDRGRGQRTSTASSRASAGTSPRRPTRTASCTRRPPGTASIVVEDRVRLEDDEWLAVAPAARSALDAPISIYEVHLGSWKRVPEDGFRSLNYRELAARARPSTSRAWASRTSS